MRANAPVRVLGVVVFVIAAALLTSIGGLGMVASPITIPTMYLLVRVHPTRAFRIAGVIIGGLTGFEGGWLVGVIAFGYDGPATLVTSLAVGIGTAALFATAGADRKSRVVLLQIANANRRSP